MLLKLTLFERCLVLHTSNRSIGNIHVVRSVRHDCSLTEERCELATWFSPPFWFGGGSARANLFSRSLYYCLSAILFDF